MSDLSAQHIPNVSLAQFIPRLSQIDPDKRNELACQVALLLGASASGCGPLEIEAFDGLFIDLVDTLNDDTRAFISDRLATIPNAPHGITLRLAQDEIRIARPILIHSAVLTEDDLLLVCDRNGNEHMFAIAHRPTLTSRVTDVLVLRGDNLVRVQVARNEGASISSRGFTRLASQARDDLQMEQILVTRPDLPGAAVQILVRSGSQISRIAFAAAVKAPTPTITRSREFESFDFAAARAEVDQLTRQGIFGESLLLRFIAEEKLPEALVVMARLVGVSVEILQSWYVAEVPDNLLVAAKAYGLDARAVFGLLGLGRWRQTFDAASRQAAVKRYQSLTKPQAVKLLGDWRKSRHAGSERARMN
eukprot:gene21536-22426_t